jgi:hypothetical protein
MMMVMMMMMMMMMIEEDSLSSRRESKSDRGPRPETNREVRVTRRMNSTVGDI